MYREVQYGSCRKHSGTSGTQNRYQRRRQEYVVREKLARSNHRDSGPVVYGACIAAHTVTRGTEGMVGAAVESDFKAVEHMLHRISISVVKGSCDTCSKVRPVSTGLGVVSDINCEASFWNLSDPMKQYNSFAYCKGCRVHLPRLTARDLIQLKKQHQLCHMQRCWTRAW